MITGDQTCEPTRNRYGPLALVAGTHAFTHMFAALMPLVYPVVILEFGISYAAIGLLEGVSRFAGGLLQGPAGLLGRFVPRNILLGLDNIFLALSMGLISISPNFTYFFAANLMGRVAQSPQHPIGNSLISEWFDKKLRGITFAINYGGANMGSLIVPLIAGVLFAVIGWRGAVAVFIIPGLIFGLLAIFMIPRAGKSSSIQDSDHEPRLHGEVLKALKDRNSGLIIVGTLLAAGGRGLGVMSVYIPLYLRDTMRGGLGLDATLTGVLFTILLIGSVIGPVFIGRVSDRFGRIRMLQIALSLASVCTFLLAFAGHHLFYVIPILLVMGFANSSFSMLYHMLLADMADPSVRDIVFSLYFPLSFAAGAIWSFGLGLIADGYTFQLVFIIAAISPILALPFLFFVRDSAAGKAEA